MKNCYIYISKGNAVVYDPFLGSGTTAIACKNMGIDFIGSEISENQVKWANERLSKIPQKGFFFKGNMKGTLGN